MGGQAADNADQNQLENTVPRLPIRPLQTWGVLALLAILTLATYWPVLRCDFVEFDDFDYVKANPHILTGLSLNNLAWAFQAGYASNWHPVTWLSHMLDAQLFGAGPGGPHLVNLLLHVVNVLLLFAVLKRFTGAFWRAALVAGLFALHPLHVESVAWVSERKDVLSTCFGLLSLCAYGAYARRATATPPTARPDSKMREWRLYLLAWLLFALSLMSKPMLVTLPLLLLLLDYWPLGRIPAAAPQARWPVVRKLLVEKLPFFLLSAISAILTLAAQNRGGAVRNFDQFSVGARLGNAVVSYARYLAKAVWPTQLSFFYPNPGSWPALDLTLSALLLMIGCVAAARLARTFPFVLTGWYWYLIALLPVIGLVQVGAQAMADRYTYIPLVGPFILFAWGTHAWLRRYAVPGALFGLAAGVLLCLSAWLTRTQLACWQNTETLYRHALAASENNPQVVRFLGYYYYNLGNAAREAGRIDEAIARYRRALELDPTAASAHNNLGMALQAQGRLDQAAAEYLAAITLAPTNGNARNNLAVILAGAGKLEEAVKQFSEVVRLSPDNVEAQNNLGTLCFRLGDIGEAIRHYTEAVRLAPQNPVVHNNLGDALRRAGRLEEAVAQYRQAQQIAPQDPVSRQRLQAIEAAAKP